MNRRFYVGISINPTDEKRRLVVIGATPTRKKCVLCIGETGSTIKTMTRHPRIPSVNDIGYPPITWIPTSNQP